jgi:hypothetical protein
MDSVLRRVAIYFIMTDGVHPAVSGELHHYSELDVRTNVLPFGRRPNLFATTSATTDVDSSALALQQSMRLSDLL